MTTAAENELLTRVGPGTPMGEVMRHYWLPALRSQEVVADGEPRRFMLLGEKLIAFRETSGRVGVMDHRCPHRCASLFFGRNEEGGIRCVYHGWKFDVDGTCLDMANVPPHQDFKSKVKAKAYKAAERNGLIWVFMGDQANVPKLPPIEVTLAPEEELDIQFLHRDCNWLQGLEGELDTSHLGVLHFGAVAKASFEGNEMNRFTVANRAPEYVAKETPTGAMYGAFRPGEGEDTYWRVGHFLFPCWAMPPINPLERNVLARAYVPLDDDHTMIVMLFMKRAYHFDRTRAGERVPGTSQVLRYLPTTTDWLGRWRVQEHLGNDYLIDREVQRTLSFTGIDGVTLQDQAVTESMGPTTDRPLEHLAPSDLMINRTRRILVRTARDFARDGTVPASATDPSLYEGVRGGQYLTAPGEDWVAGYQRTLDNATLRPPVAAEAAE